MAAASPYTVSRRAQIAGVDTAWWETDGDGPAILAVHGFRGDHHGLAEIVRRLPGRRIVVPDLPGFGATPAFTDRPHTLEAYTRFITAFAAEVLAPRGDLLGHSFGSIIAAHAVAAGMPARSLILVNPIATAPLQGSTGASALVALAYYRLGAALPVRSGEALLRASGMVHVMSAALTCSRDPAMRHFVLDQHLRYFSGFADRHQVLEAFRASIHDGVMDVADRLTLPTLLVAGERDRIAPLATQRRLTAQLRHGTLRVIPNVGHLAHYETPAQTAAAIADFLAALP